MGEKNLREGQGLLWEWEGVSTEASQKGKVERRYVLFSVFIAY